MANPICRQRQTEAAEVRNLRSILLGTTVPERRDVIGRRAGGPRGHGSAPGSVHPGGGGSHSPTDEVVEPSGEFHGAYGQEDRQYEERERRKDREPGEANLPNRTEREAVRWVVGPQLDPLPGIVPQGGECDR